MTLGLTIDRLLRASPERLYAIWTDSTHLSRWFGVKVTADARVGGELAIHFYKEKPPLTGRFTELHPHDAVAFTWNTEGTETNVRVTFQREGELTRLTLKHDGFASEKSFASHDEGWFEYFELWAAMLNLGPDDDVRASISGFVPAGLDVPTLLASWLGKRDAELAITEDGGVTRFQNGQVAAQWQASKFGLSLAVTEWGFTAESQRAAARSKWEERFAALGK